MSEKRRRERDRKKPVEHPEELSPIPTAAPSEEPQVDEVDGDREEREDREKNP